MADKITQSPIPNPQYPHSPPQIQAVIQSRLAHLTPSARELAQLAAVVGRAFSLDELATFSGQAEMAVGQALEELCERRIIRQQGSHSYDFSHDRIRDVALGEINPVRRGLLHRQIAAGLQQRYGDELDPVVDALAWHCEQAGLIEQAVTFYKRAAILAESRFAYAQAGQHSRHALDLLATLPPSRVTRSTELELLLVLAEALRKIVGFASPELMVVYHRASVLWSEVGTLAQLYQIKQGLWGYHLNRSELQQARIYATEELEIVEELGYPSALPWGWADLAWGLLALGDFTGVLKQINHALPPDETDPAQEVNIAWSAAQGQAAQALWLLGYPAQAQARFHLAEHFVPFYPGSMGQVVVLDVLAQTSNFWGDGVWLAAHAEEMERLTAENGLPLYFGISQVHKGFALARQGHAEAGIARLVQGLAHIQRAGTTFNRPYYQTLLAEAYGLAGQAAEAMRALDESIALAESSGEVWWLAEQYRLRGELLAASGQAAEAAEWMQRGLEFARSLNARSLELRAAHSLARLSQRRGPRSSGGSLSVLLRRLRFDTGFPTG